MNLKEKAAVLLEVEVPVVLTVTRAVAEVAQAEAVKEVMQVLLVVVMRMLLKAEVNKYIRLLIGCLDIFQSDLFFEVVFLHLLAHQEWLQLQLTALNSA